MLRLCAIDTDEGREALGAAYVHFASGCAELQGKLDPAYAVKRYTRVLTNGNCAGVFALRTADDTIVGGLGALATEDHHWDELVAVATFWFVQPEYRGHGILLFDAFEQWGASVGCKRFVVHLADIFPASLERFYTRRGYRLAEKHFLRVVKE